MRVGELHGAEVVADGAQAGHEGEVGAGDGEDEGVVGGVGWTTMIWWIWAAAVVKVYSGVRT